MKVLLVNYNDKGGGAAAASFRLLEALIAKGIHARLLVWQKETDSKFVIQAERKAKPKMKKVLKPFQKIIKGKFITSNPVLHSENKSSLIDYREINESDFDVIHLHWINHGLISIEDLSRITKPIVWTMHDTWPFCGAEHYPNVWENDDRYKQGYFSSNKPFTTVGKDICRSVWNRKRKFFPRMKIHFISPSEWERGLLRESALFKDTACEVIRNIIPSKIFSKKDKDSIRSLLGLPLDKKILCFGAAYDIKNEKSIKGGNLLLDSLRNISNTDDYYLIVFGPANADFKKSINIPVFFSGYIDNPVILSILYCASNAFLCPSVIENLPNTCVEAIRCGVPVVAYSVGGIPEVIKHKHNGFLAKPYDVLDFTHGIDYCINFLGNDSNASIETLSETFNEEIVIENHLRVYHEAIGNEDKTWG